MSRLGVVVQDVETKCFLCPSEDGDVSHTPWIDKAGVFFEMEEAREAAAMYCSDGARFRVVSDA